MAHSQDIRCLIVDDEAMARDIIASHLAKIDYVQVVGQCKSAMEAFSHISQYKVDLLFLDINMPEINGISFANSIPKHIKIIFTTAYRDYAVEGFELRAVDYLLKPISFERLLKSVSSYMETRLQQTKQMASTQEDNEFIFVRSERKMIKIDFQDIHYIESYSDYLKIHLEDQTVVTRETISAIEGKLPQAQFLRIHRSFIIALAKIASFTNEELLIGKKSLPISRSYKKSVLHRLEGF